MTVASRIAVMDHGELVQVSTPGDIYEEPQSRHIANFIGEVNILEGKVKSVSDGYVDIAWAFGATTFKAKACPGLAKDQQVWLAIRPEKIRVGFDRPAEGVNALPGKVSDVGYLGSISHYHVDVAPGVRVRTLRANSSHTVERPINWEDNVWLEWPADAGVVLTR